MSGNPLLNMMGNNSIQSMINNNPMMYLISAIKNGGNPMQLFQQMASHNPRLGQAMNMINGKSSNDIIQMVQQAAKKNGVNAAEFAKQIGAPDDIVNQLSK